jgi:hypothetical protein
MASDIRLSGVGIINHWRVMRAKSPAVCRHTGLLTMMFPGQSG